MKLTRRDALMGATAAAAVTGLTVAPLAMKAASVEAALAGDPVLPAYEAFEAVRREYIVADNPVDVIRTAVDAEMPPEPHRNRTYLEMSPAERDDAAEWGRLCHRRVTARLGMDEDSFMDIYYDRTILAYEAVADIRATTVAGLLCQVRAWWSTYEGHSNIQIPNPEESPWEPKTVVQRLYHDIARLAGEVQS